MTREEAIRLAQTSAFTYGRHHSYVEGRITEWEPHEWVVEAILAAYNRGHTYSPFNDEGRPG